MKQVGGARCQLQLQYINLQQGVGGHSCFLYCIDHLRICMFHLPRFALGQTKLVPRCWL